MKVSENQSLCLECCGRPYIEDEKCTLNMWQKAIENIVPLALGVFFVMRSVCTCSALLPVEKCVCLKRFLVHVNERKLKLALAHNLSSLLENETDTVCIFKKCKARFFPKILFGDSRIMFILILLQSRGSQSLLLNFLPFGICPHQKLWILH